jgi:hypothetical protein
MNKCNQVQDQAWYRAMDRVSIQVGNQLWNRVEKQIFNQVCIEVRNGVLEAKDEKQS